jgi:hypothetical protein
MRVVTSCGLVLFDFEKTLVLVPCMYEIYQSTMRMYMELKFCCVCGSLVKF